MLIVVNYFHVVEEKGVEGKEVILCLALVLSISCQYQCKAYAIQFILREDDSQWRSFREVDGMERMYGGELISRTKCEAEGSAICSFSTSAKKRKDFFER